MAGNETDNLKFDVDSLLNMDYNKAVVDAQKSSNAKPEDNTFWKFKKDVANTYIFRFIPDAHTQLTYVNAKYHYIKHFPNGKPVSVSGHCKNLAEAWACPSCSYGSKLWKTGNKSKQEEAKRWFAKDKFISNILMINDPVNPENNGKVFKFEFTHQVLEKILKRNSPDAAEVNDPGFKKYSPFHPIEAGNFIFKVKLKKFDKDNKEQTQPNYEESYFDNNITPISTDKAEIVRILQQTYNLSDYMKNLYYLEPEKINAELGYLMTDVDGADSYTPPVANKVNAPSEITPPWVETPKADASQQSTVVNTEKVVNATEADFIDSL